MKVEKLLQLLKKSNTYIATPVVGYQNIAHYERCYDTTSEECGGVCACSMNYGECACVGPSKKVGN